MKKIKEQVDLGDPVKSKSGSNNLRGRLTQKCGDYTIDEIEAVFRRIMEEAKSTQVVDTESKIVSCVGGTPKFRGEGPKKMPISYKIKIVGSPGNITNLRYYDNFEKKEKDLSEYFKFLKENLNEQKNNGMNDISDKLDKIYFYSVSRDGVSKRVLFTTEDISEIKKHLEKLMDQGERGDKAFIKAVVLSKGFDKNNEPIIKLGSFPPSSQIDVGKKPGLMSLLNTVYFSIINKEGPDPRDLKIVIGDIYSGKKSIPSKEDVKIEKENNVNVETQPIQTTQKEEPFEEVMKKKEKKGLETLLNNGEVTNNLTKKQKNIIKNLTKKGFKFTEPKENKDTYIKKKIKSREFSENLDVWVPKNQ